MILQSKNKIFKNQIIKYTYTFNFTHELFI